METNSNLDIWISGAFAVVIVDFLVYPVDTLKTRIQSPHYNHIYKDAATGAIRKNRLFRGLYQGVVSVVLSTIPASGAFFTTYEGVKSTLNKTKYSSPSSPGNKNPYPYGFSHSLPTPVINVLSSSAGELVSCFMLTPAEVIKQNAQVLNVTTDKPNLNPDPNSNSNPQSKDLTQRAKTKPKSSRKGERPGWRKKKSATLLVLQRFRTQPWKLWSGYTALAGRNLPFTGVNFPIFEAVKGVLVRWREERNTHNHPGFRGGGRGQPGNKEDGGGGGSVLERAALTGLAGSISGSIASVVTTPVDVVKTRMMLAAAAADRPRTSDSGGQRDGDRSRSAWAVGRRICRDEGIRGLFRGGAIRVVWTAFSFSIYLGIYEGGRFYLEKKRRGSLHNREEEGEGDVVA